MNNIQNFRKKISQLSDEALLTIVNSDITDYSKGEVEEVWGELERRGLATGDKITGAAADQPKGISWQALGLILSIIYLLFLFILPIAAWTPERPTNDLPYGHRLMITIAGSLLLFFSIRYATLRRKYKAISAQNLLAKRPEDPVLYLRSFGDESVAAKIFGTMTEAEQLALVMNKIGPFIAIGRPGETLPELGAARMYVSDDHWQKTVAALMLKASLVVVRIGRTRGLLWEVKRAIELVKPERLLFLVPRDQDFYERFRERANQYFPCTLPEYLADRGHVGSLKGAIYFEPDWTPHFVKFDNIYAYYMGTVDAPGVPALTIALRPVFRQLQVKWRKPSVGLLKILRNGLIFLLWVLAIYNIYHMF